MNARIEDVPFIGCDDPVKAGNRSARREAAAGRQNLPALPEFPKAAAVHRPFVEIAHHHRRTMAFAIGDVGQYLAHLLPAPESRQIEVHADDTDRLAIDQEVGTHGPTRLQDGERYDRCIQDFYPTPHEDGVAMPAKAVRAHRKRHWQKVRMFLQGRERQGAGTPSKAAIGFLQRNDISIQFVQYRQDPVRHAAPINADRLADIVTCES